MELQKWQALGNHFLVCERSSLPWPLTPERVRLLCNPALGLGADGVLELELGDAPDVAVTVHNADGSIAEVSGNGTRIAVAYAAESLGRRTLSVHAATDGSASIDGGGRISVTLGRAALSGRQEDRSTADPGVDYRFVSTGNPHCVIAVDEPDRFPLASEGPRLEHHPRFPERANVEAFAVIDRHRVRMRVWERGVGETQACGSGACAVAVAAIVDGRCESPVEVEMPGGVVEVAVSDELEITLTGEAERVFVAALDQAFVARLEGAS